VHSNYNAIKRGEEQLKLQAEENFKKPEERDFKDLKVSKKKTIRYYRNWIKMQ
jgi:hypothetical protein